MNNENDILKRQCAIFGRTFALLFNRSFMYSANHPFQVEAINSAFQAVTQLLLSNSPSVFIMHGEKFYVDDEPLDPRLNVSKIVAYFKKAGMESISFYKGVEIKELQLFFEIATTPNKYPDADSMSKTMFKKQINHIKINHIFYKKVSTEDEVIRREILDKISPDMIDEDHDKIKQMLMGSIFSSILQEDFVKNLNLNSLLKNPGNLSSEMIAADLSTVKNYKNSFLSEDKNDVLLPGQFLLHQLEMIDLDVERKLTEGTGVGLQQVADALFEMRQKLFEGIEAQKVLGIAYTNEEEVYSKAAELTDKVLIRLIKEEYKGGEISVYRLAQILHRIIPEPDEIKRLLPKIKTALIEEGMSQADFMILIQELGRELQSDGLINILSQSADEIGIDGNDIIRQVKDNPLQSTEMIYLASEIRKAGGDENALTDILVNYVEQVGSRYSKDLSEKKGEDGEKSIKRAMVEVKSNLIQRLGDMDIKEDTLKRMEERVNQRIDDIFNKLRSEWINSYSSSSERETHRESTVLETLERGVSEDEDLGKILKHIREKAASGQIDENDFDQIYKEIAKQEQLKKSDSEKKGTPFGIMREKMFMTYMDKEIARAKRFDTSLSILAFTLVKAKAKTVSQVQQISTRDVIDALLHKLVEIFRTPDIIGEVGKNQFIVLLPMTHRGQANSALRRAMKILHLKLLEVGGVNVEIKVAGVVANINLNEVVNAELLLNSIVSQLKDMATRIANLHSYS